jgi:ABC-type branched-subunit amino acid transport system ATPase component
MTTKDGLLRVEDIRASYYKKEILHGVSLTVHEREIVSLIGPNGAGKSTLLKVIAGALHPLEGNIHFNGEEISHLPPHLRVKKGIGYFIQGGEVFPNLSVKENLELGGFDLPRDELRVRMKSVFELFPELSKMGTRRAGLLSGGQRQALALGIILMRRPKLLLLDEPSAGLAPNLVREMIGKVRNIREDLETSVLIVEQNVREALKICNRVYLLKNGLIAGEMDPKEGDVEGKLEELFFG